MTMAHSLPFVLSLSKGRALILPPRGSTGSPKDRSVETDSDLISPQSIGGFEDIQIKDSDPTSGFF